MLETLIIGVILFLVGSYMIILMIKGQSVVKGGKILHPLGYVVGLLMALYGEVMILMAIKKSDTGNFLLDFFNNHHIFTTSEQLLILGVMGFGVGVMGVLNVITKTNFKGLKGFILFSILLLSAMIVAVVGGLSCWVSLCNMGVIDVQKIM